MRHDRTRKLACYRKYGVRECWLVDLSRWTVEVHHLQIVGAPVLSAEDAMIRSSVLPRLRLNVRDLFED
jgi:Uma2 family endonuclease